MAFPKKPSFFLLALLLSGCGAVPISDRYGDKKNTDASPESEQWFASTEKSTPPKFDFAPYETKLSFVNTGEPVPATPGAWYQFAPEVKPVRLTKSPGYRVQLLSTDSYEEAQKMQDSVIASKTASQTYLEFEAPFYKIKVGDITDANHASELQFKLRQLGFKNPVVTQDTVNIRQK